MAPARASWYGTAMRTAACACVLVALAAMPAAADTDWISVDRVAAVVNHDIVLASDLERELGTIPELAAIEDPNARAKRRDELRPVVLDDMIERVLYRQQAVKANVTVDDADIDAAIQSIENENHIDAKQLEEALVAQGYTLARYRVNLRDQLTRLKVAQVVVRPQIAITDADVKAQYDKLKASAGGTGVQPFDKVKDEIQQQMISEAMAQASAQVAAAWRAEGYVVVRLP